MLTYADAAYADVCSCRLRGKALRSKALCYNHIHLIDSPSVLCRMCPVTCACSACGGRVSRSKNLIFAKGKSCKDLFQNLESCHTEKRQEEALTARESEARASGEGTWPSNNTVRRRRLIACAIANLFTHTHTHTQPLTQLQTGIMHTCIIFYTHTLYTTHTSSQTVGREVL